ncbi:MAG: hypothetical protein RLZZ484_5, partial [Pseudomonadota bacterium]
MARKKATKKTATPKRGAGTMFIG